MKRFNFYDFYGYLVPGFILLSLLWLPFGWIGGRWPPAAWGSAAAGFAVSYAVGFVMQQVATRVVPSKQRDKQNKHRYPSDIFLDDDDKNLSCPLKHALAKDFEEKFRLPWHEQQSARREIFALCRAALRRQDAAAAAEQFQGLYALSRGLLTALAIAALYHLGWLIGSLGLKADSPLFCVPAPYILPAIVLLTFGAFVIGLCSQSKHELGWLYHLLLLGFFIVVIGFLATQRQPVTKEDAIRIATMIMGEFAALFPLWRSYKEHSRNLATTVYYDYYTSQLFPPKETKRRGGAQGETDEDSD